MSGINWTEVSSQQETVMFLNKGFGQCDLIFIPFYDELFFLLFMIYGIIMFLIEPVWFVK